MEEDGGELVGSFFELGGEGDAGVCFGDGLGFEVGAIEAEGGLGDGDGEAFIGAEGS